MASISAQARKVERRLREKLPEVRHLEAYYESKKWRLSWSDGPTSATMKSLLGEPEITRLAPDLPAEAWALYRTEQPMAIAVRMVALALEGKLPPFPRDYEIKWAAETAARHTDYPEQTDDPLCAEIAARLHKEADGSETRMGELITERGIAWLHPAHQDTPEDEQPPVDLSDPQHAVRLLTTRYAKSQEEVAWRRSLTPIPARDAVMRTLADPDAEKDALLAAYALLPLLRAELDGIEGQLMERSRDQGATWPEIGRVRGTTEQAAQQLFARRANGRAG